MELTAKGSPQPDILGTILGPIGGIASNIIGNIFESENVKKQNETNIMLNDPVYQAERMRLAGANPLNALGGAKGVSIQVPNVTPPMHGIDPNVIPSMMLMNQNLVNAMETEKILKEKVNQERANSNIIKTEEYMSNAELNIVKGIDEVVTKTLMDDEVIAKGGKLSAGQALKYAVKIAPLAGMILSRAKRNTKGGLGD